jgi:hypothetical protein
VHTAFVPIQRARKEHFAAMANANFYARFINTRRLKTILIGSRRYTTDGWIRQCVADLVEEDEAARAGERSVP